MLINAQKHPLELNQAKWNPDRMKHQHALRTTILRGMHKPLKDVDGLHG